MNRHVSPRVTNTPTPASPHARPLLLLLLLLSWGARRRAARLNVLPAAAHGKVYTAILLP